MDGRHHVHPDRRGWPYLAIVLDLFNREVVGWPIKPRMTADSVIDALTMAWFRRSRQLRQRPWQPVRQPGHARQAHRLLHDCLDEPQGRWLGHAATESFFNSLKNERVHGTTYAKRADAQADLFEYIEVFNNRSRRHSTPGCSSPVRFLENWISKHAAQQSKAA